MNVRPQQSRTPRVHGRRVWAICAAPPPLPPELWAAVLEMADPRAVVALRATCRLMRALVTPDVWERRLARTFGCTSEHVNPEHDGGQGAPINPELVGHIARYHFPPDALCVALAVIAGLQNLKMLRDSWFLALMRQHDPRDLVVVEDVGGKPRRVPFKTICVLIDGQKFRRTALPAARMLYILERRRATIRPEHRQLEDASSDVLYDLTYLWCRLGNVGAVVRADYPPNSELAGEPWSSSSGLMGALRPPARLGLTGESWVPSSGQVGGEIVPVSDITRYPYFSAKRPLTATAGGACVTFRIAVTLPTAFLLDRLR